MQLHDHFTLYLIWFYVVCFSFSFFFFQAEDGIRDVAVTGVQTCALPISGGGRLEQAPPTGAVEQLAVEFTGFAPGTTELQLFARDARAAARAGRRRALRTAVHEIKLRLKRSEERRVGKEWKNREAAPCVK